MPDFRNTVHTLVTSGCDLSLRQIEAIMQCQEHRDAPDGRTVRALAIAMKVSKPAVTRALDRLATEGYGARKTDPLDRRSVIFNLSAKGRAFPAAHDARAQPKAA